MSKNVGGYVDVKNLRKLAANSPQFKREARKVVTKEFKNGLQALTGNFLAHPVTQELQQGAKSSGGGTANISNTLGGYGNLYGFIGSPQGHNPINIILQKFKEISLNTSTPKVKVLTAKKEIRLEFKVTAPTLEDLYGVTPLPWSSESWARGIEKGIPGIGAFLSLRNIRGSRSKQGIQSKNKLKKQANFKPTPYLTKIYGQFLMNLKGSKIASSDRAFLGVSK